MELKYKFSKTSISRMKGVDPRLIILITSYLALGKKDIGVSYGARTEEEQIYMLQHGKSKVTRSKHLLSKELLTTAKGFKLDVLEANAIDIVAYRNGKPVWEKEYYKDIIIDMKEIAKLYGWKNDINWGWDFKSLDDPYHISVKELNDEGIKQSINFIKKEIRPYLQLFYS